jgi:hypothetical protein
MRFLKGALLAMAAVDIAGCFTPLRLYYDTIRYFNIKDCIEYGCTPGSTAAGDFLPYGYPILLALLSRLGILQSFTIVLINCLYAFAGLYLLKKIFRGHISPVSFGILVLFNWTWIIIVTCPLSEMQYFFLSSASLYFFFTYTHKKNYAPLVLSALCCILAVVTRAAGIALAAGLTAGLLWHHRDKIRRIPRHYILLSITLLILGAVALFFVRRLRIGDYSGYFFTYLKKDTGHFILSNLDNHFTEAGELFLNVSLSTVEQKWHIPGIRLLYIAAGLFFFGLFIYMLVTSKDRIPFYIKAYLLLYSLIIFNWPYYDPRFWVPIFPLMLIVLLSSPVIRWTRHLLVRSYLMVYFAIGIVTAAMWLYTGFNKQRFARAQNGGIYRKEYEIHFFDKPQEDSINYNQDAINILRRYDRHGR